MVKGSGIGDCGQAPERQHRLSSAPKRRGLSSRGQRVALKWWLLERWVAASAAVRQGTLTMLRIRLVVVRLPGALGDRVEAARIPAVGVVAVVARVVVVRPAALAAEAGLVSRHLSHPGSVGWERCCRGARVVAIRASPYAGRKFERECNYGTQAEIWIGSPKRLSISVVKYNRG